MSKNPLREFWIDANTSFQLSPNQRYCKAFLLNYPDNEYYKNMTLYREVTPDSERELKELRKSEAMLAFMIENEFFVCEVMGRFYVTDESFEELFSITYQTPREAIAAAMAEQGKKEL